MDIDHMVLALGDLAAGVAHYDALLPILGFRKVRDHVFTNDQGIFLELRQAREPEARYARRGVGLNHFGVRAGSRDEVDAVVTKARAAGVRVPDTETIDGTYLVFIPDPDGIRIEVGFEPVAPPTAR
jgi:catechol 2,3-dioxygenase-like lactoylglutathione lyase family enzyme